VTFGSGWALIGLAALVPLVALHLRDRHKDERAVPSLALWRELEVSHPTGNRGLRLPRRPWLLLLEALALVLFVIALAEPHGSAATPRRDQIIVLDDSIQTSAPGRLAAAKSAIIRAADRAPAGDRISIVVADANPHVLYRGAPAGAASALQRVGPNLGPSSLSTALPVAAGLVAGPADLITVVRSPGDSLPRRINGARDELRTITVGGPSDDQGIFDPAARCGIGAANGCEIEATIANFSSRDSVDRVVARVAGRRPLRFTVRVPGGGTAPIVLGAVAGEQVTLRLEHADTVASDDMDWVTVPQAAGPPARTVVTLVGQPGRALALAQAFAAVPNVKLRLRTPSKFHRAEARSSDLVILDHWLPKHGLPPAASVLLVDPPRVPGGHVTRSLADTVLAGTDPRSPLLDGVNLSSLAIDRGAAHAIDLPSWIAPAAWSASGPLLAAGDDGRMRLAVLAFEPSDSDLPQLAAFPLLAANIVDWAGRWAPAAAQPGDPISVDATPGARSVTLSRGQAVVSRLSLTGHPVTLVAQAPGRYTISETGPGVSRVTAVDVNAGLPATATAASVDLRAVHTAALASPPDWSPWFLLAALLVLCLEWLYWLSTRPRTAA
jgi:hypothetical protein